MSSARTSRPGPAAPGPAAPGPGQARPGQARPGQARPGQARPGQARPGPGPGNARPGIVRLLTGAGLAIAVLVLGVVAKTGPVASLDLRVDEHIAAHDRTSLLTALAKAASTVAKPEIIGIGLLIVLPIILVLTRRRLDALQVFLMVGTALALAEAAKKLIAEHRPPVSLQAMAADSGASYPSGHATTAAILAVAVIAIAAATWRYAAIVGGGLYVLAVAASRVYLADHYPVDVLGGIGCALAAAYLVTGLAALPVLQPHLRRFDTRGRGYRSGRGDTHAHEAASLP
jgi:membrane-associated phospholipid phosphatase